MANLNTTCYTIEDGKIVEGTLSDFDMYIEKTTRPTGVGYKYYATTENDVWVLAKWATWGGPQVVVREFETEDEAKAAAEETYVYDILNNQETPIYLDRADAESALAQQIESDA